MTQLRPELRVEIRKLGNRYQAITRTGDGHEVTTHEFQYDTGSLVRGAMVWAPADSAAAKNLDQDPVQVAAQGWRLYRDLFDNGRSLREYLSSHHETRGAQLTLCFDQQAVALARLPWEYLYDGDTYLSLSGELPVTRRPYGLGPISCQATPRPLKILLVIAAPEDQVPFEVEREMAVLQEALDESIRTGAVQLDVLSEPTSMMLLEATQTHAYHVIHYIGHGVFQLPQHEGFVCLEDNLGRTELVNGEQLPRFLGTCRPHLVLLSGCPGAQYGLSDAFAGVVQGLLQCDVPAALSVPVGLRASSAVAFYRALYGGLAGAETVAESLYRGRLALSGAGDPAASGEHRFDWAIPVLYQRDPHLRLIDAGDMTNPEGAPVLATPREGHATRPMPVIGRKSELYTVRSALKESCRIFYIWGSDGVGKRRFVSHVTGHLTSRASAPLVIRCHDGVEPLTVLGQIAQFWRSGGSETDEQAAHLLLDARQDPFERAKAAQMLVAAKRLLYSFQNIDRWFAAGAHGENRVANATMRDIILGLLSVPSKSLFFFTGARRWDELLHVETADLRAIYLPLLPVDWAVQVMNHLPGLRSATRAQKQAVYWHLGGHPKSLELLAGWLSTGQRLEPLLAAPPVEERSTGLWEAFLIDKLLDQLDPGELQVLRSLVLLSRPFSATTLSELTPVTQQYAQPLVEKWYRLGLIESAGSGSPDPTARFDFYLPVRDALLHRLSTGEVKERHLQAAAYYGAPFVDAAHRQVLARNITAWTHDRIEWLARDTNGILGTWLRQQTERGPLDELLGRAMAWQEHLFGAGKTEEATQVVQAIAPELKRQDQVDLAEALLQRTVKLPGHTGYATGVDQLAQLRLEEGPLSAALNVYRQVYESLDAQRADLQRAHVLMRAAMVQHRLGNTEDAIKSLVLALQSVRREGDKESEAECLYRLAMLHREAGDLRPALVYSQAAREHYEAFDSPSGLASMEREQGLILKELGHLENALECFAASLRICRRLGDIKCITENLTEVGLILDKLGRHEMAIKVIEEALQHYEYLRSPEHSEVLSLLEELYARKQRLDEAIAKLRTARSAPRSETPRV